MIAHRLNRVLVSIGILAGAMMMSSDVRADEPLPEFDKLWNYSDPAATDAKFREILPRAEAGGSPAYLAELLTQVARCQGLRGKFDEAHATLDRVEKMLTPQMKRPRVRYLLERGRAFKSGGAAPKALPLFEEAWELGQAAGELRLAGDAIHMIAIAQPDPAKQIEWNLRGIQFVADHPSERGWLPAFYNNLAEAYAAAEQYEPACKAFRDLAELELKQGREPEPYTQKDIAKMLRKLGRVAEAKAVIRPVYEAAERTGKHDGWLDDEMAECLLAEGNEAEAKPLFGRAYEALKDDAWVKQHEPGKIERLKRLGE